MCVAGAFAGYMCVAGVLQVTHVSCRCVTGYTCVLQVRCRLHMCVAGVLQVPLEYACMHTG